MRESSLYYKIYEAIRGDIEAGKLPGGARLPTEAELSTQFGVSSITVKKALSMLTDESFIHRVPGKGSFITSTTERKSPAANISFEALPVIGLILEHVTSPFGLDMLYTLDKLSTSNGYKLCIGFSYGDREKETREIKALIACGAKGIIIMPSHGKYYSTDILRLVVADYPVVLIDKQLEGIPIASVCTDNENATALLVRHLKDTGRRNIGMISTANYGTSSIAERRNGFYNEMKKQGLKPGVECLLDIHSYDLSIDEKPYENIKNYLQENIGLIDAVICSEYCYLLHIIRAANELGIIIPKDIAVCSIDEDYLAPGGYFFTHVKQDENAIAEKAMVLMLNMITSRKKNTRRYNIQPIFKKGRST